MAMAVDEVCNMAMAVDEVDEGVQHDDGGR